MKIAQPSAADTLSWLLAGDPAIGWQTRRDLIGEAESVWGPERRRTLSEGWAAQLLAEQDADGRWGGGLYSPKWVSTTYTLLLLRDMGLPRDCEAARRGTALVLDGLLGALPDADFQARLLALDRCIVGMILSLTSYFGLGAERVEALVANLLAEIMPDGAWNCRRMRRPRPHHSSFHTTLNVLEGLRDYLESGATPHRPAVLAAEQAALELLLQHQLFRSDRSGEVIDERFTKFSFPTRWYYDVLRALSYFARADAPRDPRLGEAIELLRHRRRSDGCWPVQNRHAGKVFFDMEKTGGPSRWNTLRALRVLKWWEA